ncbi:MAG: AAA family ATPase [Chitinophagaceae bacterium]|nr:AAA family ATPase [Chitinophagaceae bacterium]
MDKPMYILDEDCKAINKGDKNCLRNVMLCGSPSGKTVYGKYCRQKAGVPAFYLNSPKNQYVGESERKAKLMFNLLKQLGGFGIIDEVELIFPLNRNQSTGDSGVTQNIQGQLQSFLSDPSLSGKTVLVGTSNRPNAISEAMRQRWTIVPVLMPLASDFPAIV